MRSDALTYIKRSKSSIPITRSIAGCARFFTLTHCFDRPASTIGPVALEYWSQSSQTPFSR